ncbi:MAG: ShlB/FhaC/HecB family hemolysin secretion/activation protein [Xenococcaceae cyanobacterium MO_167.B27]|nr:ShlB/FhaC/HecB family hemolysin secretion/activation protein [Xenococcaceae cyanobacterium MO_167.B27]
MPINETPVPKLILATEPENQSSQAKSAEFCPIKTKAQAEVSTSEYLIPLDISVENSPVSIEVKGSTILSPEEIQTQIDELFPSSTPSKLTAEEFESKLEDTAKQITALYLKQGYFNSKAIEGLPTFSNQGIVGEINVIEGSLDRIEVKGRKRLNLSYICSRIGLGVDTPLNFNQLEDQLRLLRVNPLFKEIEATLGQTGEEGKSNLVVEVTEANPLIASVGIDNYSPPSVGSVRFGATLGYRNVTGLGDTFAATYYRSTTGGSDNLDVTYQVPLNAMDGTLLFRVAPEWREVTQSPFDRLDIEGEKERYEISYRQPLIRTPREEFALSLGFSYQDDETTLFDRSFSFTAGPEDGESRTRTIQFGQEYINRDQDGAWSLRSQLNFGVGLFDATDNESPTPDGNFFSWQFQAQRLQVLGQNNLLIIQGDLQLTPNSLLPNQQFTIGGGQSVRGYRQNARFGDNGLRFSIEDRITLAGNTNDPNFQLAPFIDLGYVWNKADNPNKLPDQQFLIGAGLGLLWEPLEKLQIRLDYGIPIIDLDDRGDDVQDDGFYFSVNYGI